MHHIRFYPQLLRNNQIMVEILHGNSYLHQLFIYAIEVKQSCLAKNSDPTNDMTKFIVTSKKLNETIN